jgi:O-antigen/teichoic acid export membrane protein
MGISFLPAVFVLGLPGVTHFYIDPGTGSLVLQAVIGGLVAAGVAVGMFWRRIKAFLGRFFSRFKHPEPPQDQQH